MYTRSELSNFWDSILISAASRNALKKFSQKLIVFSNNNKNPDNFPFYAPRTDFFVDNMISPGYFKDRFMDTFGPVAYVLEHCGIYFSVFFFKLIKDVVVMVIRHLEINKMTGASLGFGKTLLSASYNIFLMSVLTSMYDSRAPTLAAVEEERETLCNEEELQDMREDNKRQEEHIYPVMCPAPFNQAVTPIFPVYICLSFFRPNYTPSFPLVTIVFHSSPILRKTFDPLPLLVWTAQPTLSSLSYLLFLLHRKYLLIQRRLTRRLLYPYKLLTILQLQSVTSLLPPQLDYTSQFRCLKLINLKLQKNFLLSLASIRRSTAFIQA